MSNYWEDSKKQPDLKTWLEFYHGCLICACDHGCNQWVAENAGKAYILIESLQKGQSLGFCDGVVQTDVADINNDIFQAMWEDMKKRSKKSDP